MRRQSKWTPVNLATVFGTLLLSACPMGRVSAQDLTSESAWGMAGEVSLDDTGPSRGTVTPASAALNRSRPAPSGGSSGWNWRGGPASGQPAAAPQRTPAAPRMNSWPGPQPGPGPQSMSPQQLANSLSGSQPFGSPRSAPPFPGMPANPARGRVTPVQNQVVLPGQTAIPPAFGAPPSPMPAAPAMPPGFNPYPKISPFENGFQRTRFEDGLWTQETRNLRRNYYFQADGLFMSTKGPGSTPVGNPNTNAYRDNQLLNQNIPVLNPANATPLLLNAFVVPNADIVEYGQLGPGPFIDPNVVQEFRKNPINAGIQLRWGWENEDHTGFEIDGWYLTPSEMEFRRGTTPIVPAPLGGVVTDEGLVALAELTRVTGAVTYEDNTVDGQLVPYDLFYRVLFDTSSGGTGIKGFFTPRYDVSFFKARMFWGLRYMFIRERFNFYGVDSGLLLAFNPDGSPDTLDNADILLLATGTGNPINDPFFTVIDNGALSHLVGPQLGVNYELGGDNLKLWGNMAVGLMANAESIELNGQGAGNGLSPIFDQDRTFSDSNNGAHVSPAFEFSVNASMNIVGMIPGINRLDFMKESRLRVGYQAIVVGEVARPQDSIIYRAQPFDPIISVQRSTWYTHGLTVGFDWEW